MRIASSSRAVLWASPAALILVCAVPARLFAQAWLPPKGASSVSIGLQSFHVPWHLEADGSEDERADIRINNVTAETTYGLSDKIALDFGLPYVASRYGGDAPESARDDGTYYATFQDFRLNVRYAMSNRRGLALTPSLAVVLPSHEYDTLAHTAPGRHLYEVGLGLNAGRSLAPALPDTYVHAYYSYALAQRLVHEGLDLSLNRSNADVEVGHLLTSALTVRGFASWQRTHGGLEWTEEDLGVHEDIHDRAARASYWRLGAGVTYSVNGSLDVSASVLTTVAGRNTHKVGGVVLSTTWTFGRGGAIVGVVQNTSQRVAPGMVRAR